MSRPSSSHPGISIERFAGRLPVHSLQRLRLPDGRFRYAFVSPTVTGSFGIDAAALMAAEAVDHDWIHPEDRARFVAALHASADALAPLDEEVRVLCGDGTVRWIRSLGEPARLADGTVAWEGVALDVTDRREAQDRVERMIEAARRAEVAASADPPRQEMRATLEELSRALSPEASVPDLDAARRACDRLHALHGIDAPGRAARAPARGPLTARQREIGWLVAQGLSNREIARRLGLVEGTVKLHVTRILARTGLRNRTELALAIGGRE